MRRLLLFSALALVLPGLAFGQSRTGRIEGTVYNDEGMPMAGAKVVASSPTQIGGTRKATTDAEGGFRFIGLIPGVFKVVVQKAGFLAGVRKELRVSVGKTATLDILLDRAPVKIVKAPAKAGTKTGGDKSSKGIEKKPAAKGETYVITARPVVDVTKSTTGESLSDEYLESVPTTSRSFQAVAGQTAAVTQRDGGNPSVAGGAYFNNSYLVDGVDTTDPVTHTFGTNFNFDAMSDINILTGGMGPEHSDTPGGVINMVTKSGSNTYELDASIYYADDALTIKRAEELGSTLRNLDVNINVGGPIIKDKLWFYTSFELNESTSTLPPDPNGILPDHPSRRYLGGKFFGKLTWQLHPKHKLVFWAQTAPASIGNSRQAITVEPDAEAHQNQFGALGTLAWEWLATDNLFLKTQLSFSWNGLRVFPQSGITDVAAISDIGTGIAQRNYSSLNTDDRYRISVNTDATYFLRALGKHEFKGGLRYNHLINPSTESITGNEVYNTQFGQPYSLTRYFLEFDEVSACDPTSSKYNAQNCLQAPLRTSVSGNKLIAFLQDTWQLPNYDRFRLIPGVALHFGNNINPAGETITNFVTATAHLNFAWDLFDDGKTVLRGGYNQYVDVGFLSIARFIGQDLITYRCNYDEDTGAYTQSCRVGGQIRTVGKNQGPGFDADGKPIDKFNPDALTIPRVHEFNLGLEREWFSGFSTGVDFQYRQFNNQWEDVETNVIWNEAGDDALGFRNGKSEFIFDLETPEEAQRRYVGLTLFAHKFIGNWQMKASYTWSRYEGTVSESFASVFMDRARQNKFADGFLPEDRRHVIKVSGWYRWRSLTLGGSLWFGTGTPYDKLYFNSFFNDYSDRRAPRGYDPKDLSTPEDDEELRTPARLAINLKVSYKLDELTGWLFGSKQNIDLVGEVFNALNLRTATSYEQRVLAAGAATQFGDTLNRQSPFSVRFGLRYRY